MAQFHQQSFSARFGAMGDEAEGVFEGLNEGKFVRYGLNRPPVNMAMLTPFIRYTPDYLVSRGLVEVQGVGKDRKLKLKIDKALALQQWSTHFDLLFFIWDTTLKRSGYVQWKDLWAVLPTMPIKHFPEGKPYWEIDVDNHIWVSEE
jgi:hypothetical protein